MNYQPFCKKRNWQPKTMAMAIILHISIGILVALFIFQNNVAADNSYNINTLNIDRVYVYTSIYTQHTVPKEEHVNDQDMFGVELRMTNKWLYGFARFDNSFGQQSEYLYAGHKWQILKSSRQLLDYHYFKLTGGLLHGYKNEYKDKIPLNNLGVAPAFIPTYGYQRKNFLTEVSLGGASVVLLTFGYIF